MDIRSNLEIGQRIASLRKRCGLSLRESGGGSPSDGGVPPGRGHVRPKSRSHTATWLSASMPRMISPKLPTQLQIAFSGEPLIWP